MEEEIILQPALFEIGELADIDDDDALLGQIGAQFAPALLLGADEIGDALADPDELIGRRQPVVRRRDQTRRDLVDQAGHPHHEEFVEIARRNRQEAQLLEQRMAAIARLLEHAAVEFEPGEFAIDEARRALRTIDLAGVGQGGRRFGIAPRAFDNDERRLGLQARLSLGRFDLRCRRRGGGRTTRQAMPPRPK